MISASARAHHRLIAVPLLLLAALSLASAALLGGVVRLPAARANAVGELGLPHDTTCGRAFFGAATGADGRVYAIGGTSAPCGAKYLDLTQAYDPQADSWTNLAPMPTPRELLAVTAGSDGRIYAIGGQSATSDTLNTVEAYTPATNSWATLAPMPTARHSLAAATGPGGLIYAFGGYISAGTAVNTVEVYDPQANSWKAVAPMTTPRDSLAGVVSQGRVYALGGQHGTGDVASVEVYTPATNTWQAVAPMTRTRGKFAAAAGQDGRVYAISDDPFYTNFYNTTQGAVEVYDPIANSWSDVPPLASPRWASAAATLSDGRILAIGGETSDPYCSQPSTVVEGYDPITKHWLPLASLPGTPQAPTPGPACTLLGVTPIPTNTPVPARTPVAGSTATPAATPPPTAGPVASPTATPAPVSVPGTRNTSGGQLLAVLIVALLALVVAVVGAVLLVGRSGLRAPDASPDTPDAPPPPGGPSAPAEPDAPTQPGE